IGKRFNRHHSTRESVNAAGACVGVVNRLRVQDKRTQFVEQLQPRQLASAHLRAAIVDLAYLRAQAADVDRKIEKFFATQFVKHREHFLRFSEREHRNEHATAPRESILNRVHETLFFVRARPGSGERSIAAGAFHHEDVDPTPARLGLWKNRGLRDRLIIKVYVAGVKQRSTFRANKNSSRTENVSG